MKKIPYESLNNLQQFIAGWAGDKDGGCPVDFILENAPDHGFSEEIVKQEISNMVTKGILVQSVFGGQLHYPEWRPNESLEVCKENKKGRWEYQDKKINYDYISETSGIIATLPDGTEKGYKTILEASIATGVEDRLIAKILRGFASHQISFRRDVIKRERQMGSKIIQEKIFFKPPKKGV